VLSRPQGVGLPPWLISALPADTKTGALTAHPMMRAARTLLLRCGRFLVAVHLRWYRAMRTSFRRSPPIAELGERCRGRQAASTDGVRSSDARGLFKDASGHAR